MLLFLFPSYAPDYFVVYVVVKLTFSVFSDFPFKNTHVFQKLSYRRGNHMKRLIPSPAAAPLCALNDKWPF